MKYITLLLLFFVPIIQAQENNQLSEEKVTALREAAARGEQIFGGIMLTQKCNILSDEEYAEFESKAKAIIQVIKQDIGQEKINIQVQRAKIGVASDPYDKCGDESKEFVLSSKMFVEKTYEILSKKEG